MTITRGAASVALHLLTFLLTGFAVCDVRAQEDRWEAGARFNVITAGGEPANDIMSAGLFGRYRLNDRWLLGFAVDQAEFDFERPWRVLGLQQDPSVETIDATTVATVFSVWAEREHARAGKRLRWFWSGGLGFTSPDVDDVTGPLLGGGTFDITADAGSEFILAGTGGLRLPFARRWVFDFQVRLDHHFADWEVVDRVSTTTGTLDDYTGYGGSVSLSCRF